MKWAPHSFASMWSVWKPGKGDEMFTPAIANDWDLLFSLNFNLYEDYVDILYWLEDILKEQPKNKYPKKSVAAEKVPAVVLLMFCFHYPVF